MCFFLEGLKILENVGITWSGRASILMNRGDGEVDWGKKRFDLTQSASFQTNRKHLSKDKIIYFRMAEL